MKNLLFCILMFSGIAAADTRSTYITPCQYWNYTQTGYQCTTLAWQMSIYTSQEVDQMLQNMQYTINSLQQKIDNLEQRIQALENAPH